MWTGWRCGKPFTASITQTNNVPHPHPPSPAGDRRFSDRLRQPFSHHVSIMVVTKVSLICIPLELYWKIFTKEVFAKKLQYSVIGEKKKLPSAKLIWFCHRFHIISVSGLIDIIITYPSLWMTPSPAWSWSRTWECEVLQIMKHQICTKYLY